MRQRRRELKRVADIMEPSREPSTIKSTNTPQTTSKPRAVGVILAVILGATACTGLGGGGTTTVVTSVVNNGGGNAAPTTSTSNSKAVNDKATLCRMWLSHLSQISAAIDDLNRAVDHENWSWSEPKISAAGDEVVETIKKQSDLLKDTIGPEIPQDTADALRNLLKSATDYAAVIEQRGSNIEIKPVLESFRKAEQDADPVCGYKN